MSKSRKISLHALFRNKKFTIVFSVVLAIFIWLFVAVNYSPVETRVINNVPVTLNLKDSVPTKLNLRPFGEKEYYVDVTVKGKRVFINQSALTAEDLIATAVTNQVDSAGKHSLQVKVSPKNSNADFEIIEYSNDYIQVYFDTYKESEYTIEPDIICDKLVPEGYISDDIILSSTKIAISGPAAEMDKINKVIARVEIDEPLTATETYKAEIVPVSKNSESFKYLTLDASSGEISVTVPVLKKGTLPVGVSFKNVPAYYLKNPLKVSARPSAADIAMPTDKMETAENVNVGVVDFSTLSPTENKFVFKAADVTEAKITDDTEEFSISIDMSGMGTVRGLSLPSENITKAVTKDGKTITVNTDGINGIEVVGPEGSLSSITSDRLTGKLDISKLDESKTEQTLPVVIGIRDMDNCWVYGSYTVPVTVE